MRLTYVDAETVHRLLPYVELVEAMAQGHLRSQAEVRRVVYSPEGAGETFLALTAWQPGEAMGVKLVTVFPQNLAAGRASVQGVYVLFDGADGSPLAVIDGTALTYRKTACDSALGSRFLSRPDSRAMLMIGAGGLAPHLIAAHRAVCPSIENVLIWNRTRARAERLAAAIGGEVAGNLEDAIPEADIICSATMAQQPLISGRLVRPGTHLDLVGAFKPDHREIDDDVIRRGRVYVDSRLAAVEESGDLVIPLASGLMTLADIHGDLFELCHASVPGRTDPDQITVFENGGGGHLDLMAASLLWSRFREG
jgi:ornithine cyclodeaminase